MSEPFAPLDWTETGAPTSRAFGDIYFSSEDGLAETRTVFLEGCGLPGAWAGRSRFTLAELGFGTGLNIAAALMLWRESAPKGARLNLFSVEAFPVCRDDAARALSHWPELAEAAQALLAAWPTPARGFQRLDLPGFRATLDVAVMEVEPALTAWSGVADAWFLDGFSPALNPDMWSPAVMQQVAQRSRPGAVAATFTVAGAVRRGLEAAGFTLERRPGHGRKKERLVARLSGEARAESPPPTALVIGDGIAGASLARALRAQGIQPTVIADDSVVASGNPAALVAPGLDASGRAPARLYAQTFDRAVDLYRQGPAVIAERVTRRPKVERDHARFAKVAALPIFSPGAVTLTTDGELVFRDGLVVDCEQVLRDWLHADVRPGRVTALSSTQTGWLAQLEDGGAIDADLIFIAAGWGAAALTDLPLDPVRGQASFVASDQRPAAVVDGDYLIPTRDGFLFGATHQRGRTDAQVDPADHRHNLAALHRLAPGLDGAHAQGRAAVRAATRDFLPAAGELSRGLHVLTGLGSRGFTTAPLLAEHVVAQALDLPSPLPADLAKAVAPGRLRA